MTRWRGRLIRPGFLLWAAAFAAGPGFAQLPVDGNSGAPNRLNVGIEASKKVVIRGTVVNSVTRAPIARALVRSNDGRLAKFTDDEGHFEFSWQAPKSDSAQPYMGFFAMKPGFMNPQRSREIEQVLVAGDAPVELTLLLRPEALIVGHVTAAGNDGREKFEVVLYQQIPQGLRPGWRQVNTTRSRSDGQYRFFGLEPGDYKIFTRELMDRDPLTTSARGQQFGYPPSFYPAADDFASAATLHLQPGETVIANLTPVRRPYYPVKIGVTGGGANGISVEVERSGHEGPGYTLGVNSRSGMVEGTLPDGQYTLRVVQPGEKMAGGNLTFAVNGGPAQGASVAITTWSDIEVRVHDQRKTVNDSNVPVLANSAAISLYNTNEFAANEFRTLMSTNAGADSKLQFQGIGPGTYQIKTMAAGPWYVAALESEGKNLLHEPLGVGDGATPSIDVTIRDDGATLDGKISGWKATNEKALERNEFVWSGLSRMGRNVDGGISEVLLIPTADSNGQYRATAVGGEGTFHMEQIPPGEYRIVALEHGSEDLLQYITPEVSKGMQNKGQLLELTAGQAAKLEIPFAEEKQ